MKKSGGESATAAELQARIQRAAAKGVLEHEAGALFKELQSALRRLAARREADGAELEIALSLVELAMRAAAAGDPPADRVVRALRLLRGGDPSNDAGARRAQFAKALRLAAERGARSRGKHLAWEGDAAEVVRQFAAIHPKLAALDPERVSGLFARLLNGSAKLTGLAAEIAIMTRAFGTTRESKRARVQQQFAHALKRHP